MMDIIAEMMMMMMMMGLLMVVVKLHMYIRPRFAKPLTLSTKLLR